MAIAASRLTTVLEASSDVDTERLKCIIRNVENSLERQELSLSPSKKADLITHLYTLSNQERNIPDKMTTDRLVWMA